MTAGNGELVSVILPTKDRPKMLARAVRSVLEQSHEPIELIVVDDGPEKPADRALEDLPLEECRRFVFRRHETSRGANAARNTGLEAATGDYVAFLDDDDEWLPEKLAAQVEALQSADGNAGVAFTGNRKLAADGSSLGTHYRPVEGDVSERILFGNFVGTFSGVLIDRAIADGVGPLDERFPAWQDWEYYVRLAQHCEFVGVPGPFVVRYMDHDDRISPAYAPKRSIADVMLEEKLLPAKSDTVSEARIRAALHVRLARVASLAGHYGAARSHAIRAVATCPGDPSLYKYVPPMLGGRVTYLPARKLKRGLERFGVPLSW